MIRPPSPCALAFALMLLTACGERAPAPSPDPANQADAFDNAQASTSIIRPTVAEEVEPEPTPTPEAPPEPIRTTIGFATGTALDEAARAAIDALAAQPAVAGGGAITLAGHSDSAGSDADNLAASRRRAEAVRARLVERGIDAARITVVALGERRPAAPNALPDGRDDPAGRARNRRVEVTVLPAAASGVVADPQPAPGGG